MKGLETYTAASEKVAAMFRQVGEVSSKAAAQFEEARMLLNAAITHGGKF